jgi:hypothetical protein
MPGAARVAARTTIAALILCSPLLLTACLTAAIDREVAALSPDSDGSLPTRLSLAAGAGLPDGVIASLATDLADDEEWVEESDPNVELYTHEETGCWVGFTTAKYLPTSEHDLLATRDFFAVELGFATDPMGESYPLFPLESSGAKGAKPQGTIEFVTYVDSDPSGPSFYLTSARVIAAAKAVVVIDLSCPDEDLLVDIFPSVREHFTIVLTPKDGSDG